MTPTDNSVHREIRGSEIAHSNSMRRFLCSREDGQRSKRVELLARELTNRFQPLKALDIGCGVGGLVAALQELGVDVKGVDISETAVSKAALITQRCCQVVDVDCEPLPFDNKSFDLVIASSVLQHLQRPGRVISEMWRVLRPAGIAVVLVPLQPFESILWQTLKVQRDIEHIHTHSKYTWIRVFELNGFQYVGNLNPLVRQIYSIVHSSFWLARKLERGGPLGKWLWKQLVPHVEGSLLFRSLEFHPSVPRILSLESETHNQV